MLGTAVGDNVFTVDVAGVPDVPDKAALFPTVAVPIPKVAVSVNNTGFWVSVGVSCGAGVSVGLGGTITGVILGSRVGVGKPCSVCCERTAAVAGRSSVGRGTVVGFWSRAGEHELRAKLSTVTRKNNFFIANSLILNF
jgi:hypothetical protein